MAATPVDLVCVSHLWWDWVWQRPQQLLSRLAGPYRVLWVEEPRIAVGPAGDRFEITTLHPNLRLARLVSRSDLATFRRRHAARLEEVGARDFEIADHVREAGLGFESPLEARLEQEVRAILAARREGSLVLWLYTPSAVPFIDRLQPDLVVYDVMDDLTAFAFAPPQLRAQEQELFARADLVFAGGPSLYEARKSRHPDIHLFPSGVEAEHFARALDADLPLPPDVRDLGRPIIGYFGVLDERLDLDLLAGAAAARPEWAWVLIGPVLKIEERSLPRRPNLHYLGRRDYADLPAYLKAFDVAMLPFARNEATRSISPTKTLEYMAAHRPIVSTPIADVIALYGSIARIAEDADAFVAAVEAALGEGPREGEERVRKEAALLDRYAWGRIATEMRTLIDDRLARKRAGDVR